jgi:hypothetical protein
VCWKESSHYDGRLEPGSLADILVDRARHADCVFIGPTARHTAAGPTAAERVAAHSVAAVCVVPMHTALPGGPIVVGVAGIGGVEPLLRAAVPEADRRGVALHAVYVWTIVPAPGWGASQVPARRTCATITATA